MLVKPLEDVRQISAPTYGFIASKALFAALELDLFSRIARGARTLPELARATIPDAALLRGAFELTDAEARLAARLAGDPLDEVCDRLRIAKETGRNHLKSVFAKTGAHRQSELVVILSSLPSPQQTLRTD
jgi:DNA-binding CsgD family transcriptional regulator